MNRGLLDKSAREVLPMTLLCGVGALAFEVLLAFVIRSFEVQIAEHWIQIEAVRNILKALIGSEVGDQIDPRAMTSIAWVHPILLTLLWGHEIALCSRTPAGEVDRATIDVLFGLPVSRWSMYLSETVVWMSAGLVVVSLTLVGGLIGLLVLEDHMRPTPVRLAIIAANLYGLYLAVGGMALWVSSLCDRRGRAVALALAIVMASFLLSFLAQFWEPAKALSFLTVLEYHQPLAVLRHGTWPIANMITLAVVGALFWLAGAIVFLKRDICTV